MNIKNHKKTLLLIIATLILFFGYWFFFISNKKPSNSSSSGLTNTVMNVSNTQYDREFVESLLSLSYVNLDMSIFNSRTYQALNFPEIPFVVNFSRESGRDNPFLPIGVDQVSTPSNIQNQLNINTNTGINTASSTSNPVKAPVVNPTPNQNSTSTVNPIKKNF
jgi:hypothetical protein